MSVKSRLLATAWALSVFLPIGIDSMAPVRAQAPPNADGLTMPNLASQAEFLYLWNGTSWDRALKSNGGMVVTTSTTALSTVPLATPTTITPGTIIAGGTFQNILAGNATTRKACKIYNQSITDVLYVSQQLAVSSTIANSIMLQPATATVSGGSYDCATASGVPTSAPIAVMGATTGDAFMYYTQ